MRSQNIRESRKQLRWLRQVLFTTLLVTGSLRVAAQEKTVTYYADPASVPADLPITIRHLTARIGFTPEENLVTGSASFTFSANREKIDSIHP